MCFSWTAFQVRELLNLVVNGKLRFSINRQVSVVSCSVRAIAGSQGLELPPLEGHCCLRKQHWWILPKVPRKCKNTLGALTALHLTSAELVRLSTPCFHLQFPSFRSQNTLKNQATAMMVFFFFCYSWSTDLSTPHHFVSILQMGKLWTCPKGPAIKSRARESRLPRTPSNTLLGKAVSSQASPYHLHFWICWLFRGDLFYWGFTVGKAAAMHKISTSSSRHVSVSSVFHLCQFSTCHSHKEGISISVGCYDFSQWPVHDDYFGRFARVISCWVQLKANGQLMSFIQFSPTHLQI